MKRKLPGYIALGLLISVTTFWTYWGAAEAYYEGWWGAWYNPLPYLVPAAILMALTLVGIRWPRVGGWTITGGGAAIFVGWMLISEFTVINLMKAFLLGGLAALVGVMFILEDHRRKRMYSEGRTTRKRCPRLNLPYLIAIGLPFLVIFAMSIYWLPVVLGRVDDGNREARVIAGNEIALVWAPAGPGWNESYHSWNEIAFYGVPPAGFGEKPGYEDRDATIEDMKKTGLCAYLAEDGLTIMDDPQYIWQMPTVDEIVRSLVRHGENAGCTWDGGSMHADCSVQPDKETPLWAPDQPPIYYWAADEYDEREAYYVSFDGNGINHQPKSWGNQRCGYRFVREP